MLSTMICALILIAIFFAGMITGGIMTMRDIAKGREETMKIIEYFKQRCGEC